VDTRHLAVSLSNRRIRGANFIKKRDFSIMTAFNDVLSVELKMLRDDEMLLLSLDLVTDVVEELETSLSCLVGFFGVVMAETSADER
jgi:hypothetical protein